MRRRAAARLTRPSPINAKDVGSGTIRAQIKVGHLPNLGRLIAKYGGAARVIAPVEAREIVRNYALSALGAQSRELDREVE